MKKTKKRGRPRKTGPKAKLRTCTLTDNEHQKVVDAGFGSFTTGIRRMLNALAENMRQKEGEDYLGCPYCGEPKNEKIGCCGEAHFEILEIDKNGDYRVKE